MSATSGLVAGLYYAWVARRDSNGYPMGTLTTPDAPVAGSTYSAYFLQNPVTYSPAAPTRDVATLRGGQKVGQKRDLGVSDYGNAQLVLADFDEGFHALVSGSSVDTTIMTAWTTTTQNARNAALPQLILGIVVGFTTASGSIQYATMVYHNVQIQPVMPGGSESGGTNPNTLTYNIVPNISSRTGLSRLFSASSLSATDNSDVMTIYRYTSPIYVTTFIKDASTTTFIFPYRPVSSDATGAASNSITNNGSTLAVTSVSTTTGTVTLAAAGSSGDIVVAALPTNFVAL